MNETRFGVVELILRDICELERDDPAMQDTICIDISVLKRILDDRAGESMEAMAAAIVAIEQLETENAALRKEMAQSKTLVEKQRLDLIDAGNEVNAFIDTTRRLNAKVDALKNERLFGLTCGKEK